MKYSYQGNIGDISHLTKEQRLAYLENRAHDILLYYGVSVIIWPPKRERFFLCPVTVVKAENGGLRFYKSSLFRMDEISVFKTERLLIRIVKLAIKEFQKKRAAKIP